MPDETCRTIKAQYHKVSAANFIRHNAMGATAILEIMEEPKTKCLNSKVNGKQPSLEHRIYDVDGISTAVTTSFHPNIAEPKIIQVGNYMDDTGKGFKNPQCGRVYSPDGIAPTLNTCGGGQREPKIIQIGSYSPSSACNAKVLDADGICPTLLDHKGAEPAILTPIRTEEQRQLRKKGIDTFGGRQMLPRTDGVSNTITTVVHDNLVFEPRRQPIQIGAKYGRLTVLEKLEKKQGTNSIYRCQCECGNVCEVNGGRLGISTMSCGCLKSEAHRTHGESQSRLYNIWTLIKRRCNNPNTPNYDKYGGRGIKVCDEWLQYEAFRDWAMQNGYSVELTIDRINNNGDYCPENCRWATHSQQVNNRNPYGIINYDGITIDSKGLRCQIMVNGRKEYVAHSLNDVAILIDKRNRYIRERGLPHKIQEYKHDYDFLLKYHSVLDWIAETQKDNLLQEPIKIRQATEQGYIECPVGGGFDAAYPSSRLRRGRVQDNGDVVGAITAQGDAHCVYEGAEVIASMQANAMRGSIDGVSPCLTEAMGMGGGQIPMVTEQEPCGCYDNQSGEFAREPLEGVARTLKADHHNAVMLRKDDVVFKEMPDGNIHAYRAHDPKKSTAPEWQITNADNIHLTLTTSHEPKVLLRYRIRKLTPTECFRLMGCDDSDIEKLKSAKLTQVLRNGKIKEKPMPKTQLYKMAGNSIVVDVLYHLFKAMFISDSPEQKPRLKQYSIFDYL